MTRFTTVEVTAWLESMHEELAVLCSQDQPVAMIGIKTGGVNVAQELHRRLALPDELGELNISFYRDDFSKIGLHPVVGPSNVPFSVEDRHIILVDDVLSTGRTVRAAMNEIFDYGRPSRITLAVLVQRSGHELPVRADVIGKSLDIPDAQHVSLNTSSMSVKVGARD